MDNTITPTHQSDILDGAALVAGFGQGQDGYDWSLRGFKPSGEVENPDLAARIAIIARMLGAEDILAPYPTKMNSEITGTEKLKTSFELPLSDVHLWRGVEADGVRLQYAGDAFAMSAADCALVVVKWRTQMWAAHAGRDSLIDRTFIKTNGREQGKRYKSVVDSIMHEIPRKFLHETVVYYGCTISKGEHFEHPIDHPNSEHADFNKKMLQFIADKYSNPADPATSGDEYWKRGQIDIRWLIRKQFERYDVTNFETDQVCTFSETDPAGNLIWHSNRRDKIKRNLFLVIRR